MEKDILQKKDPFLKTVGDMYQVLAGWKHNYAGKCNRFSDANDLVAFATTDAPTIKGNNKNKR